MSQSSTRAILYALGANLGIGVAKAVAAAVTGSGAMLAEAIHSLADCTNQVLLFIGMARSRRPPTPEHPLGHGKAVFFWSFLVAVLLFSMGGLFSLYKGVHKLRAAVETGGHGLDRPWVAVVVLAVGIVLEGLSLAGALRESRSERRGRGLWRWFRTSRRSELLVVVGEDLAAVLGLAIAMAAVLLAVATGDPAYDAWGSIAIGVLLVVVAVAVGAEVRSLLIGESADPDTARRIRDLVAAQPGVDEVLNLITLQLGPEVMVAVKARMAEQDTVAELVDVINRAEVALKRAFPEVRWVFFEPDVRD